MDFEIWHYWLMAGILFFALEIFLSSFVLVSIGVGCLFAMIGALLGINIVGQLLFLIAGILVGFLGVKPLLKHYASLSEKELNTNYKALIGRVGRVCDTINEDDQGHVMIDGDTWQAVSLNDIHIEVGTRVKILAVNSIVLTVEPIQKKMPASTSIVDSNAADTPQTKRLMVNIGKKQHFFGLENIICFYSDQKTSFMLLKDNESPLMVDDSLDKIEKKLPQTHFFRGNRQFIISPDCVRQIKRSEDRKLTIILCENQHLPDSINISRLKAAKLKAWLSLHTEKI